MKRAVVVLVALGCGGGQRPAAQPKGDATLARFKAMAVEDPVRLFYELGIELDQFEGVAKKLYAAWASTHPRDAARAAKSGETQPPQQASPKAPAHFTDENGVTVVFNDHKWFCFQVSQTSVNMCAISPAECMRFAEAMKSAPTCGVREAATCIMLVDKRDGSNRSKCFSTPAECQAMYGVFVDENTKIESACSTLRYRGY